MESFGPFVFSVAHNVCAVSVIYELQVTRASSKLPLLYKDLKRST